jgi:hypothetical protein
MTISNQEQKARLALIRNFEISGCIDITKLSKSKDFEELVKNQIKHAGQHGDWTALIKLLQIVAESKYYKPLLVWCCDVLSCDYDVHGTNIYLVKRTEHAATGSASDLLGYLKLSHYLKNQDMRGTLSSLTGMPHCKNELKQQVSEKIQTDLIKTLRKQNSWIYRYINLDKVAKSHWFHQMLEERIEHTMKHGDWSGLLNLIELFARSRLFNPMLTWCCDVMGFGFELEEKKIVLKKNPDTSAKATNSDLLTYMRSTGLRGTMYDITGQAMPRKKSRTSSSIWWVRAHGSFGSAGGG